MSKTQRWAVSLSVDEKTSDALGSAMYDEDSFTSIMVRIKEVDFGPWLKVEKLSVEKVKE